VTPEIFPVSAKAAFRAKNGEPQLWTASGFEALERYIRTSLDAAARMRLKLLNPLGVGATLIERYAAATKERLTALQADVTVLDDVEGQLSMFEADMAREFEGRRAHCHASAECALRPTGGGAASGRGPPAGTGRRLPGRVGASGPVSGSAGDRDERGAGVGRRRGRTAGHRGVASSTARRKRSARVALR